MIQPNIALFRNMEVNNRRTIWESWKGLPLREEVEVEGEIFAISFIELFGSLDYIHILIW